VVIMADVVITLRIMPDSPEANLPEIKDMVCKEVKKFGGEVGKIEDVPIAYGLISANIIFVMDESKGSTDELENKIKEIKGVSSVEVTDVRRAIG